MTHLSNALFFYFIPIAAGIAFLASLTIYFQRPVERYLKYFSIFLLFNSLLEAYLNIQAWNSLNTVFINNIETLLVISFELFLLRDIIRRPGAKKVLTYILLGYPVFGLINILFIQVGVFHTFSYCLGCLLIVSACIYYFWELFQLKHSVDLVHQPAFWICSGLLFFYSCTFPLYGLAKLMLALPRIILENLFIIFVFLNIFLYLSFTIAFLCRLRTRRSMS
ncbi:MAG: hypothetical protein JST42_03520 [Bacteroidetes bacterium]|nr:hypothetical protein [Bacteroidota bacterium]